jgi:hypothetical protein
MTNTPNQMYFEISDKESVAKLDEALKPLQAFDEKLYALQKKYKVDTPFVFHSLDRGMDFSCLWFKDFPTHLDTKNEFKISSEKGKEGFEARPRKANKKFYAEFYQGLENATYTAFKLALFGDSNVRPSIEYLKKDQSYFISSSRDIVLPNTELTASQYNASTK